MCSNPWAAMLLVGMGYSDLSMDSHAIPLIKWTLMQCSGWKLRRLAKAATQASSSNEVIELLFGALEEIRSETPALAQTLQIALDRLRAHALW
jgi:signal transduction protein with GAF and PtsI domain